MECYHSLDLDETYVRCLSPYAIKTVALDCVTVGNRLQLY